MSVINHPLVRIFTTFILSCMLVMSITNDFVQYSDKFVRVVYVVVAAYILSKKIYDVVWKRSKE